MERIKFTDDGRGNEIELLVLENEQGMVVKIATLGAIIQSILVPDKNKQLVDVVLGYDSPKDYLTQTCYFGAAIGRSGNRIDQGAFTINSTTYQLEQNDGTNNLHSGKNGIHQKVFQVEEVEQDFVVLSCIDKDLEQGFPGDMDIKIRYTLSGDNTLTIEYTAVSNKDTICNFTNHSYFNLSGHNSGAALNQNVKIYGSGFTPVREKGLIPTGEIRSVEDTPMDFREFKTIEKDNDPSFAQLQYCGGFDHNYVIDGDTSYRLMAEAQSIVTGIWMKAYTDCPGMQFYAGNFVKEHEGKEGAIYGKHHGYCFESQYFPNAINISSFASPIVKANETYSSKTAYQFLLMDEG